MRSEPFRNDARGTADICSAMVAWSGALCGNDSPEKAIRMLRSAAGADAAFLSRLASGATRLMLASQNGAPESRPPSAPVSFAGVLALAAEGRVAEGQVLRVSDIAPGPDAGAAEDMLMRRLHAAGLREVAIVVLEMRPVYMDLLELHFAAAPAEAEVERLEAMTPALVAAWSLRLPGTGAKLSERAPRTHGTRPNEAWSYPVLSAANPAGLTRSEFRICLLVLEGLSPKAIAEALEVQLSTVYAHLRAVCAKTETANQLELVHRLVDDERRTHRHRDDFLPSGVEGTRLESRERYAGSELRNALR